MSWRSLGLAFGVSFAALLAGSNLNAADFSMPREFVVDVGDAKNAVPLCAAKLDQLPAAADQSRFRMFETTGGATRSVPFQFDDVNGPRIWWRLSGGDSKSTQRTFRLVRESSEPNSEKPLLTVVEHDGQIVVRRNDKPILHYNVRHVEPPAGADARYGRNAHIHPAFTPGGLTVTDQFPADHMHQSGVFLAYTKSEFEGRELNFWDLHGGKGKVRHSSLVGMSAGNLFASFTVKHEHVDLSVPNGKVAAVETWNVRVWNVDGQRTGYWVWDIVSSIVAATDQPLRLLQYHYGGMALRGRGEWDVERGRFTTDTGLGRIDGNHTRPKWCDLSGPVGEKRAGIAIMTHPSNFRFPEPLRIHPKMPYMVYAPAHLGEWKIAPGRPPHVSHYRFVVHDGDLTTDTANQLWHEFAAPLNATPNTASTP